LEYRSALEADLLKRQIPVSREADCRALIDREEDFRAREGMRFEGTLLQKLPGLTKGENPDRMAGSMEKMLRIRMQLEASSTGGVLSYVVGPEVSKGAGGGHFLHGAGRPTIRALERN